MTDVVVLCYHAVSEQWEAELAVTPSRFEQQITFLLERGYQGATFHEAVTAPPAEKTMAVTFDDGFRSVGEYAFPILARYGIPATIFVVTAFAASGVLLDWPGIDHWLGTPSASELVPASWSELRGLAAAGWEIGSHTCTHPHLTQCVDGELARELQESKQCCENELGVACRSLAYPYGDTDSRVEGAAAQAGYVAGAGLPAGRWGAPRALAWPRVGMWQGESLRRVRVKVSPMFRRLQTSAAWSAMVAARAARSHTERS